MAMTKYLSFLNSFKNRIREAIEETGPMELISIQLNFRDFSLLYYFTRPDGATGSACVRGLRVSQSTRIAVWTQSEELESCHEVTAALGPILANFEIAGDRRQQIEKEVRSVIELSLLLRKKYSSCLPPIEFCIGMVKEDGCDENNRHQRKDWRPGSIMRIRGADKV